MKVCGSFFDESLNYLKNFINDMKKPYEKKKKYFVSFLFLVYNM